MVVDPYSTNAPEVVRPPASEYTGTPSAIVGEPTALHAPVVAEYVACSTLCVVTEDVSATHTDVALSNTMDHRFMLGDALSPGSRKGVTDDDGSEPKENTPENPGSSDESVPYRTPS